MKMNVIIRNVSEPRDWHSQATGRSGVNRTIILSPAEDQDNHICATVSEEVWQPLGLQVGSTACLDLRFSTKVYKSDYVANQVRIVSPENT